MNLFLTISGIIHILLGFNRPASANPGMIQCEVFGVKSVQSIDRKAFDPEPDSIKCNFQIKTVIDPDSMSDYNFFGRSIGVSGDFMIIGASDEKVYALNSGAAYIYKRINGQWNPYQKLIPSEGGIFRYFGLEVGMSGDFAFVREAKNKENQQASLYIYHLDQGQWTLQSTINQNTPGIDPGAIFGSVAIDQDHIFIGDYNDPANGSLTGAVYVLKRDGEKWDVMQKLLASDGASGDNFGRNISLHGDFAIAGAANRYTNGVKTGAAYIFKNSANGWVEHKKLLPPDLTKAVNFGFSVSIHGHNALVGAKDYPGVFFKQGAVFMYHFDGMDWKQNAFFDSSGGQKDDDFGYKVAVHANTAVVTASNPNNSGFAHIFQNNGEEWNRIAIKGMDFPSFYHVFGTGLDLQENEIFIGGYSDYNKGYTRGFVYYYTCEEKPACAEITFPVNGQADVETDLIINWNSADRATGYMIFAGSCPDCTDLADSLDAGQTNEYFLENLPYRDTIFLRIVPYNTSGLAPECQSIWFTTEDFPAPPACAILLSPVHGATAISVYTDLHWEKIPDATGYQITVGSCSGCNNILDSLLVGDVDFVDPGILPGNDTIFVRIVPFNDGGMASGCQEASFVTMNDRFASEICSYSDGEKIMPVLSEPQANFGSAIDLSENHMVVSSPDYGVSGSATFYQRQGSIWKELNTVFPENGFSFGTDVAVDGEYAVVSDENDWGNGVYAGAVYIYRKKENGWEKTQKILADDGRSADYFGRAVDLFGEYMVVGCPGDDTIWHSGGSAYIFRLEENMWVQDTILCPADLGVNDYFGSSVAIYGDFMVISATWHYTNGAAYIYKRTGKKWNLHQKLTPGNFSVNQHFGTSVAISERFLVVTSPSLFVGYNKGEIFVYELKGDQWIMTDGYVLTSDNASLNWAKSAAAVSGEQFIIGGETAFYLFQYDGSWKETKKIFPPGITKADGFSQALGMENGVVVIGSPNSQGLFEGAGAIYSYNCNSPDCTALLFPAPNSISAPLNPVLKWSQPQGTAGMQLSLGTCPGCDDILEMTDVQGTDTYALSFNLPQNTQIYSSLRPYNMAGIQLDCQTDSFRTMTITEPLECTDLSFPLSTDRISMLSYVRWEPVENAGGYRIDIGTCAFCNDIASITTDAFADEYVDIDTSGLRVYITITPFNGNHFAESCSSSSFYLLEDPYSDDSSISGFDIFPVSRSSYPAGNDDFSLNGPYCPGEIVSFLVRINFKATDCQKLHGVIPKTGDGWDEDYVFVKNPVLQTSGHTFSYHNDIINTASHPDLCVYTTGDGQLRLCNKLYEPDCRCDDGIEAGTLLPPGWFFNSPAAACNFVEHPNFGTGVPQSCNTSRLYSFLIDLKVKEATDPLTCEENSDLNFKLYFMTDAETGCNTNPVKSRIFPIPGYHQINCDTTICNYIISDVEYGSFENISGSQLLSCYPNPAVDQLSIVFNLIRPETVRLELLNTEGKVVRQTSGVHLYPSGENHIDMHVDALSSGVYTLLLKDHRHGILDSRRIVIVGN